jgi:osmotically-inducible protein OsmY
MERDQAVRLARDTDGVRQVVDQIQIQREPAERALRDGEARDPADREPVPTTGVDEQEPTTPERRQDVELRDERTLTDRVDDGWITTKVQSQFYLDRDLRGRHIDVTTREGIVTLAGEVRTEAERQEALRIARETDGVRRVEERLTVRPETDRDRPDPTAERDGEPGIRDRVDDAWVTTKIQSQFFLDRDIKGRNIDVTTRQGVVTLSGEVESDAERENALRIARETEGVTRVDDQLRIVPEAAREPAGTTGRETPREPGRDAAPQDQTPAPPEGPVPPDRTRAEEPRDAAAGVTAGDATLADQIRTKLAADPQVSAARIDVEVQDGVVTLSGVVDNEAARDRAVKVAREIDGVQRVEDRLSIQQ